MIEAPLAYKFVATAVMLLEIDYCASRLQLPIKLPLTEKDIQRQLVFHPGRRGFAGRIDTEHYSFCFPRASRLCYVIKLYEGTPFCAGLQAPEGVSQKDHLKQLARRKSKVDCASAYRMASNWLASIEVDVRQLEANHPSRTEQLVLEDGLPLPFFKVSWGVLEASSHRYPVVTVRLFGDTGELLELRQEDDSYSRRPSSLINGLDKLLAIPDEEFLKYSPSQRSNLVARFAAVSYPAVRSEPAAGEKPRTAEQNSATNSTGNATGFLR